MNLQIINDRAGINTRLPTAGTNAGQHYSHNFAHSSLNELAFKTNYVSIFWLQNLNSIKCQWSNTTNIPFPINIFTNEIKIKRVDSY